MHDKNYFSVLRSLSEDHYKRFIAEQDYRLQRGQILDKIEIDINGSASIDSESNIALGGAGVTPDYDTYIFDGNDLQKKLEDYKPEN